VRKTLFLFSLTLLVAVKALAAETLTLTDGSSQAGDIVKFGDNGLMLRMAGDVYTNLSWSQLSQASLKHLTVSAKIKPLVEPFIEPDASQRPAKPEIQINPVKRLERPAKPALLGGLVGAPLGLFILLVLYLANLYAAFEVSVIRARPALQVIGLAAVLPVIGPVIFLAMPVKLEVSPEEVAEAEATQKLVEEIEVVQAASQEEKKKPEPQVFARGKFTFNKRFVETKFAGFIGEPKGDALNFSMEVKTAQARIAVERIAEVAATEVVFDTALAGRLAVPLSDILEIKLTPKNT